MNIDNPLALIGNYGWLGVLVIVLVTGYLEVWVWGKALARERVYSAKVEKQRDDALALAQSLAETLERGQRGTFRK